MQRVEALAHQPDQHPDQTGQPPLFDVIDQARASIAAHSSLKPRVGMILGSGMSALADDLEQPVTVAYSEIPGFHMPQVEGHRGELALGYLSGQRVAVLRGRFHYYEGYSMQQVAFPVHVLHALGCDTLLVTNAAGALRGDWQVGDIMLITDHLFVPGMAGNHPLRGANDARLGPRFPAMLNAYDRSLGDLAQQAAADLGFGLRQGVYAMIGGPSFESGAELRFLRGSGADVVGMSTAPEVVVARYRGMRVLGFSLLTNLALPEGSPANHDEVIAEGIAARPRMGALLHAILARLDSAG